MNAAGGDRVLVEAVPGPPVGDRRVELVERKGLGHPDTICDALVEAIAVALARMYLARAGGVPHYNVDKAFLVAGECRKAFGTGRLVRPMEFIVGDRATFRVDGGPALPVEETVREAIDAWIGRHLPHVRPGVDLHTRVALAEGSAELRGIYDPARGEIAANDTSAASGYAPLTAAEQLVLEIERYLNGPEFKAAFPDTGQDVKVFGLRRDDRLSATVAMPSRKRRASAASAASFRAK